MRALATKLLSPRTLVGVAAGRRRPAAWFGRPWSPVQLVDVATPELPGDDWVRIDISLGGICGSDLKVITVGMSPVVTASADWRAPMVLGHEIVGIVSAAGATSGLSEGDRVVAEPTLACRDRGIAACPACRAGTEQLCRSVAAPGDLPVGHGFGFNQRYGGGWAQHVVAPGRRCVPVPDGVDDADAVFAEPLAIAVQAASRPAAHRERALVVGPGTLGLCTLLALRALQPQVEVTMAGLGHAADDLSRRFGTTHLISGTRLSLLEAAAEVTGATMHRPVVGLPILDDGYDVVYDCVGSTQTIDDSLRLLRPGGELVLIGTAGRQRMDWTLVWQRNLRVHGTVYYDTQADGRSALERAVQILTDVRPGAMLTHVFGLEQASAALQTAAAGPTAGAVKVAFMP